MIRARYLCVLALMIRTPRSASRPQAGASGRLRARVLAGVRGEPSSSRAPAAEHGRRRSRVLIPALTLLAGVAIGGGLVLVLADGRGVSAHRTAGLRSSLRPLGSRAELTVSGMPQPPIGEVYEVWILRRNDPTPQPTDALFTVTSAGSASVDVPQAAGGAVKEVMVTSEPLGGSAKPTGPIVLRASVPGAA